ncbi:IclR family transcriptional regulator [Sporosarcina thermotolerans]|uniref:Glycerol operon regulatory protein n=1 Tax=Sporosarcina thermotolerans TaxID=633404 RepID=A0AAW9AAN7_9BACL|nr:IclR family transcriptional regulator [Sporosarcina thermotolerans]MDW0116193.1 IclR family transcriptional regulator [Sporosarcina thermotolerans]WHT48169.1 IclR family transcriptional regulator [Sporosarcina thermotolerans]
MVQSVDRALRILELLKENPSGQGVTEVANALEVAKSTAHRLLLSLERHGYVQKVGRESTYRLGLKFIEMNYFVVKHLNIVEIAKPIIEKLSKDTGEIVHLVMLDNQQVVYIDKVDNQSSIRIYSQVGRRAPLYCTAVGKSILAYRNEEEVLEYIDQVSFKRFTEHTFVNGEDLIKELHAIKKRGFSYDNEEHELGIRCVAAPIFDYTGEVQYAISVTGPENRMTDEILKSTIPKLLETVEEISIKMGFQKNI